MEITGIKQQAKRTDRYSIFVDGTYTFSLSESALLESGLIKGQILTSEEVNAYKQLSADDKLYAQALRYVALRPRSQGEVVFYLERKQTSPALVDTILNKLSNIGLIDDARLAEAFVHDRLLLRPTSRRKIIAELRKKRVSDEVITVALERQVVDDSRFLPEVIARKRQQSRYQDDQKLMSYLARQGFAYSDIKQAMSKS